REDSDAITLRIPSNRSGGSIKLEIGWENGDLEHHWFWLPELREIQRVKLDGQEFLAKRVPLPAPLRLGYHRLRVQWVKEPAQETFADVPFIVCPPRAHAVEGRIAGVAVSLYGLRSSRNW